jgi:hypothetical protein
MVISKLTALDDPLLQGAIGGLFEIACQRPFVALAQHAAGDHLYSLSLFAQRAMRKPLLVGFDGVERTRRIAAAQRGLRSSDQGQLFGKALGRGARTASGSSRTLPTRLALLLYAFAFALRRIRHDESAGGGGAGGGAPWTTVAPAAEPAAASFGLAGTPTSSVAEATPTIDAPMKSLPVAPQKPMLASPFVAAVVLAADALVACAATLVTTPAPRAAAPSCALKRPRIRARSSAVG